MEYFHNFHEKWGNCQIYIKNKKNPTNLSEKLDKKLSLTPSKIPIKTAIKGKWITVLTLK